MDIEKIMVLVRGEDKTASIIDIASDISNRKIQVTYSGGSSYFYNMDNVVILENPKSLSSNGKIAYVNGVPVYEPRLILDFKSHVRIIQKSDTFQTIRFEELSLVEDASSSKNAQRILTYLREISQYTANDLAEEAFLKQEMNQLTFVHPESVLGRYLNQQPVESRTSSMNGIIFPFRFNLSQKAALENALTYSMSVVEGPPGTGKTQTILNILANLIIQGKTVAVVSNNNEAVKNVIEKMENKGYGFLTALLGKKRIRIHFLPICPCLMSMNGIAQKRRKNSFITLRA